MLKIKNLKVKIADKDILKGVNLDIKPGEVHVLMGQNGAGKSTLVKAITDHYATEVIDGEIEYKGKNLLEMDASERANEGIFMSFQNPVEVPGVHNMYFLKTALNQKREYLGEPELTYAEFLKKVKKIAKENGLDGELLKRDLNDGFSGGEKKKNELLQLLTLKPDLILLDEIDSGLDIDAIKALADGVNKLLDGTRSVIMITHYERLVELIKPDHVHILKNGVIERSGDYELVKELLAKGFQGLGD